MTDPHPHRDAAPERTLERLSADRKVRAVAQAGSYGTPAAWAGSQPTFVTFERDVLSARSETRAGITVERFPYAKLEAWREWDAARTEAPLALLATSRVAYDPTGHYGRIQRMLWTLSEAQRAAHRGDLLTAAGERLETARGAYTGPGHGIQEQLLALADARDIALGLLYPALLTWLHLWPEFEIRLPHAWRASAGLKFPKAVYRLEALYAFGGEFEARRVLLATRGLGLVEQERRARAAFQAGYYDGAVRYLRDEAARTHRPDLHAWTHLSSARRDKLGTLLGVSRAPLGPAALEVAGDLLDAVRNGH
ncbi:hypothetical protein HNQ07_003245 [Deinococcus metalli]|uniref:Uncharacterized protein n=1 Tax=Deinococcus metalli TaxID=1141878 RepID=A0A7W8KIS2_9DEIO|nr:hypothetical protein [Deinococcus metalli]MBB5377746.1 hypothetical protein [Deinococcus metalli]GHF53031.1 hypothetical protein GCM10017781_31750 [Deinococcus metalli]